MTGLQALLPRRDDEEVALLAEAKTFPYKKEQREDGYLNMAVAENNLMQDFWKEKM